MFLYIVLVFMYSTYIQLLSSYKKIMQSRFYIFFQFFQVFRPVLDKDVSLYFILGICFFFLELIEVESHNLIKYLFTRCYCYIVNCLHMTFIHNIAVWGPDASWSPLLKAKDKKVKLSEDSSSSARREVFKQAITFKYNIYHYKFKQNI